MHNREALTLKLMLKSLKDFDLWPMYIVGLTFGIPGYPLKYYFQITMRQLGYTRLLANLLSIPNVALSIITLIGITVLSEVVDSRTWLCSMENWWFLPFYIALRTLPDPISAWVYFALAYGILPMMPCQRNATEITSMLTGHSSLVSHTHMLFKWLGAVAIQEACVQGPSRRRQSPHSFCFLASLTSICLTFSLYNMSVQVSGIIGANCTFFPFGHDFQSSADHCLLLVYQSNDAPRYYKANSGILGVIVFNLVIL